MRLVWYAGASTALAGAVVMSAFHQRSNFYSAMVHLSQSNLSIMILLNVVLFVYVSFVYCLQRLCFGQLRPVEIEQLYEKGWFAVTETCLAMTIFRDEIGAFFIIMFTALLTGKVWGWIGDGRVEILEQQPPQNPRLFHARLAISLAISIFYDIYMLEYAGRTVIQQARPNMMVMFLFEFGVLLVCSIHTSLRYMLSLMEQRIIKTQTVQGLETRRRQIREQRAAILRRRESGEATPEELSEPLPDEDDVEEMDIEVPGWEAKGHWILILDLCADFLKLGIYGAFFMLLLTFYGLPIHIMRDLFMTTRSFIKRLGALLRYRQAIKDLNKYPDATEEDLTTRESTCIICREEMHPWNPNDATQIERTRPKKLPCGHILHFGCLKSWLERQQVCPTCRRSVVMGGPEAARRDAMPIRPGGEVPNGNPANGAPPPGANNNGQQPQQPRANLRMFNLGPIRLGFAQGNADVQEIAQAMGLPPDQLGQPVPAPLAATDPAAPNNFEDIQAQLRALEDRIHTEFVSLRFSHQEAQVLGLMLMQLEMIRAAQNNNVDDAAARGARGYRLPPAHWSPPAQPAAAQPAAAQPAAAQPAAGQPATGQPAAGLPAAAQPAPEPLVTSTPVSHPSGSNPRSNSYATGRAYLTSAEAIPAGSPNLPEGLTLPHGWSLMPLVRAPAPTPDPADRERGTGSAEAVEASTTQPAPAPTAEASNSPAGDRDTPQRAPEPISESSGPSAAEPAVPETAETSVASEASKLPSWGGSAQMFHSEGASSSAERRDLGGSGGATSRAATVSNHSSTENDDDSAHNSH